MLNIILNMILKKATLMQSTEDENTIYLCIGKRRFIFRNKTYIGWYKP